MVQLLVLMLLDYFARLLTWCLSVNRLGSFRHKISPLALRLRLEKHSRYLLFLLHFNAFTYCAIPHYFSI